MILNQMDLKALKNKKIIYFNYCFSVEYLQYISESMYDILSYSLAISDYCNALTLLIDV